MRCPKCNTENILYATNNKNGYEIVLVAACRECDFIYDSKKNGGLIWKIK